MDARRLLGTVAEVFRIPHRGVVVATDTPYKWMPPDLRVMIGDDVEFRYGDSNFRSRIIGIEHADPWTPEHPFAVLVPIEVGPLEVPIGAEVWIVRSRIEQIVSGDR